MKSILLLFCALSVITCTTARKKTELVTAPAPAKALFAKAQTQFKAGQLGPAEATLNQVIKGYRATDTGDDALFLLAKIYKRQENWKQAFNVYESVYSSSVYSPREFLARTAAAKILTFKVNRPKKAVSLVDASLKQRPNAGQKADLLEVKFNALMKSGSQLEAFETLVDLSQNHPIAVKRASFRQRAKSFLDSRLTGPELKDFADDSPNSQLKLDAQYRYGVLMMEQGRYDESRNYLEDVKRSSPRSELGIQAQQILAQMSTSGEVSGRTVGVILPLSGNYSSIGYQALHGIQLALGIRGGNSANNVRLVIIDSQGKPERARRGVQRLVRENQVIAIVGGLLSKTAYAGAIHAQEMGVPFIALSQKEGLTEIGPYIFRNALTVDAQILSLVRTAMTELKIKRFAVLYPNDSYGVKLSNIFWKTVAAEGGTVTAAQTYLPGESDFKEPIQKLVGTFYVEDRKREYQKRLAEWNKKQGNSRRNKPPVSLLPPIVDFEALFVPDAPKAVGQIAPMLAYNDIKNIYLMGTNIWNTKDFVRRGQNFVSRSLFTDSLYEGDENFRGSDFYQKYSQVYGRKPSGFALQGYDSGLVVKSVLDKGLTSRMDFVGELKENSKINGAVNTLVLNKKKEYVRPVVTLTVRNGEIVPFKTQ